MDQGIAEPVDSDRVQDLIYELRVEQVMTRDVITIAPDASMAEARTILKERSISGLPVVSGDGRLVGIISIEDVIKWLAVSEVDAKVSDRMSARPVTVRADERVAEAIKKFARWRFGRLPVVDDAQKLVGILTPGDITGRILIVLSRQSREESARHHESTKVIDLLLADEAMVLLRYDVASGDFQKAGEASSRIKRALLGLGVDQGIARRIAICSYEAEMNLVIHSTGGWLTAEIRPDEVTIRARDGGPGIPDVEKALEAGYSTAPDWIRELGFGAGMGLVNVKQNADRFHIISKVGEGTDLTAIVSLKERK
jgi:CBS domain-containing protein/anti-sigma regulatory factor (Ser/Thr protein kinase)